MNTLRDCAIVLYIRHGNPLSSSSEANVIRDVLPQDPTEK
jgi:hypothetical protein